MADYRIMDKDTHIGDTIRIRRPPKVTTDDLGHNVWMSDVEPAALELETEDNAGVDPYDTAAGDAWSRRVRGLLQTS